MRSSVMLFAQRLFLWLGVVALVYAGGTAYMPARIKDTSRRGSTRSSHPHRSSVRIVKAPPIFAKGILSANSKFPELEFQ